MKMVNKKECDYILKMIEEDRIDELERNVKNIKTNISLKKALKKTSEDTMFDVYVVE